MAVHGDQQFEGDQRGNQGFWADPRCAYKSDYFSHQEAGGVVNAHHIVTFIVVMHGFRSADMTYGSGYGHSIVLSVDYENKLPTAYDDCYSALDWVSREKSSKPWLERANLSRVFLSGYSAGGNIAHQVAIKAIRDKACGVKIKGLLPIHPYFGSQRRTKLETADGAATDVTESADGSDRDYYGCNFEKVEMCNKEWRRFPAVVVYVAELDFLKEREVMYAEFLKKKGVKGVNLVEAEGESHVYHVFRPESEATRLLQKRMSEFINSH
ncbi:hypothetical protein RJ639_036431 [Escallonia herrerae]|uniref:Alpha/beta hydrolase fold-3 domain-containing protein n=1 Tax=Escallonia herrerae TaxID=1293975 RepID=A0AA89B789_9ASTE|nr:hypothetical protein RJ639_036431 [Escallonia herrerae]